MADRLADVRQRGALRWGGDEEGGGPYVYPRQDDPNQVTGFEVELANRLAEYLKVRAEFTQGQWDSMPDMLRTGKVDIILNGYELTPERLEFDGRHRPLLRLPSRSFSAAAVIRRIGLGTACKPAQAAARRKSEY